MTRQDLRSRSQPAAANSRLAAAQKQLQQRRRQRRQERIHNRLPVLTDAHGRLLPPPHDCETSRRLHCAPEAVSRILHGVQAQPSGGWTASTRESAAALPSHLHLGWESERLTQALATAQRRRQAAADRAAAMERRWLPPPHNPAPNAEPSPAEPSQDPVAETVRLYPDVGLAILREDQAAAGRIWLLLRHLDRDGRGWISLSQARKQLTGRRSPLRVCGWRQLRNLLARGDGLFWKRDPLPAADGRIWLRSVARVAASLEVDHLRTRPVALPVAALLKTIGVVRAHFYASFHSGRSEEAPIARSTLRRLSSVSRRTQQQYERRAGVKLQQNYAIGPPLASSAAQERAWRQGRACFPFIDRKGNQAEVGATYLAWQLPNSYTGPHAPAARGRQKQINRKLVDLFMKGITGNGKNAVDGKPASQGTASPRKCFFGNGQAAVRGYSRNPETDAYWKSPHKQSRGCIWHLLPGQKNAK